MTREEAIAYWKQRSEHIHNWLEENDVDFISEYVEAIDMAIEALQTDAVSRINYTPKPCEYANCDCVDVVRCKDCKWRKGIYCEHEDGMVTICDDDFCSCGERREAKNE